MKPVIFRGSLRELTSVKGGSTMAAANAASGGDGSVALKVLAPRSKVIPWYTKNRPTPSPINPPSVSKDFAAIVHKVRLPHLTLHGLRHAHATLPPQQGVHAKVVSERLGHSTVGITLDTYSHVTPNLQTEAAAKFDEVLATVSDCVRQ